MTTYPPSQMTILENVIWFYQSQKESNQQLQRTAFRFLAQAMYWAPGYSSLFESLLQQQKTGNGTRQHGHLPSMQPHQNHHNTPKDAWQSDELSEDVRQVFEAQSQGFRLWIEAALKEKRNAQTTKDVVCSQDS